MGFLFMTDAKVNSQCYKMARRCRKIKLGNIRWRDLVNRLRKLGVL